MVVAGQVVFSLSAVAIPIEHFNAPVDLKCESTSQCAAVARSEHTLGRYTGVSISRRGAGSASVSVDKNDGSLRFELRQASPVVLSLSWDGDQHPDLLSGSGLNCLDLTQGGAFAFIVSAMSIESECQEGAQGQRCPNFQIESRIYDAKDPTGQRYSVSTMTRSLPDKTDLVIPFSNFIREGPRGKGNIACVGAISISLRFEDFESVELEMGPIYTNGIEGMTPLPTPTVAPTQSPMPTIEVEGLPTELPTPGVTSESRVSTESPPSPLASRETALPSALSDPQAPIITAPIVPRVPAAVEDEEVTYGQVVE
jgi:hypothetical protein